MYYATETSAIIHVGVVPTGTNKRMTAQRTEMFEGGSLQYSAAVC